MSMPQNALQRRATAEPRALLKLNYPDRQDRRWQRSPLGLELKMDNATAGRMGDGVRTPDRIELVD